VNDDERSAFLSRPLVATVATVAKDGSPRSTPVWFLFEDTRVFIWSDAGRAWVRNLVRMPSIALSIAEHEHPFAAVLLRGTATVDRDRPDAAEIIRRISAKYVPPSDLDDYIARYAALTTIIEVSVTSSLGWSLGY
jgi:PPOX class probable F420-dependent enzyme